MSGATPRRKAVRTLVLCTVLWGLSFPTMKALAQTQQHLLPQADTWFFTSLGVMYRFGFAGVIMALLYLRRLADTSRREMEQGLVLAFFGGSGILFQNDGLAYTDASISAFLTQSYCLFIPLWVALVSRRRPSLKILISTVLVLAGVAVLARVNLHSLKPGRGEVETLLASVLFTGQILCLEQPRYAANRPEQFTIVMFFGMALLCAPVVCVTAPGAGAWVTAFASAPACGFLAILIVFCTLMSYVMMNRWQKFVTATEAGLIYSIEPVIASVLALFLPALFSAWAGISYANEELTARLFLGGGLITVANIFLQSKWLEPERP